MRARQAAPLAAARKTNKVRAMAAQGCLDTTSWFLPHSGPKIASLPKDVLLSGLDVFQPRGTDTFYASL